MGNQVIEEPAPTGAESLGCAWDRLVAAIGAAGTRVSEAEGVRDDVDLAEGYRHLGRVVDVGWRMFVEQGDPRRPEFVRLLTPTRESFFGNPDITYDRAAIRGDVSYRLEGMRGGSEHLALHVHSVDGRVIASASDRDLQFGDDGSFAVQLGGDEPGGHRDWIPTAPDADSVAVHQYFHDIESGGPAEFEITNLLSPGTPTTLTAESLSQRIDQVAAFVSDVTNTAVARNDSMVGRASNVVLETTGSCDDIAFATPDTACVGIWFEVEADEALMIEGQPPDARFWGVDVLNRWGESLEARDGVLSRNARTTTLNHEGRYRFVAAHTPTGEPNHLDLAGHRSGFVLVRWMGDESALAPTVRVVKLAELGADAVRDVRALDPADRTAATDTWSALLAALRRSARTVRDICTDEDGLDGLGHAEGVRHLGRLLSTFRELILENGDSRRPRPTSVTSAHRKLMGDNPDVQYDSVAVSGEHSYRLTGRRGSHEYLAVCLYAGRPGGSVRIVGNMSDLDIEFSEDGAFELVLASDEPVRLAPGATWVPLDPAAETLIVRQYFGDREIETPTVYQIDTLEESENSPFTVARMARRVAAVGFLTEAMPSVASSMLGALKRQPNEISSHTGASDAAELYPTPDNHYVAGWFNVGPNEALVVEGVPPVCRYWALQLWNRWGESLDWRHHIVSRNHAQTTLDDDGRFRYVLAHQAPPDGSGDWLDLAGHREGVVCFRWMQAPHHPEPTVRLVQLDGAVPCAALRTRTPIR